MRAIDLDSPANYTFSFRCLLCTCEWSTEFYGTLFGKNGALAKNEHVWCPGCGARLGHPTPAKNLQPETIGMVEHGDQMAVGYH